MRVGGRVIGWAALLGRACLGLVILAAFHGACVANQARVNMTVVPAASGRQLVRASAPLPRGMVREGRTLVVRDGTEAIVPSLRPLTWHASADAGDKSVRRALVTFPYHFEKPGAKEFVLETQAGSASPAARIPVATRMDKETVAITYEGGPTLRARLLAPARTSPAPVQHEPIESTPHFRWERVRLPDQHWPRAIETRIDAAGQVVLVAHLQRKLPDNGRAPDFGWEITTDASPDCLKTSDKATPVGEDGASHAFTSGQACEFRFAGDAYQIYHPTAHYKRRGRVEIRRNAATGLTYCYWRCTADEKVPMQQAAWRRAEVVIAPTAIAPLTPTLESPHRVTFDPALWDQLYGVGQMPRLDRYAKLTELLRLNRDAIIRSVAHGDDWGNVTSYSDGTPTGAVFGMNRLNHCPAIYFDGLRSGDRRLLDVTVLWCDNVYDQSIWWGRPQTGGTRYNNLIAMGQTPPDNDQTYMWRSNSSVNFCTKGYDTFLLAYELTGDPRMMAALDAQVRYAAQHVHADRGECRNIGDVADFVRLYEFTGKRRHLDEALRLFRELRAKLSAGNLFSQSGRPIVPDPPFIDEDQTGYKHPFAKPYIIGYALSGLPALARHVPDEPKLRDVIQAVADFLAESQDPVGGWRYPHPRSTHAIMSQAMEHAWQLVQADGLLGPQDRHLDAIERVLRQRIHGWLATGKIFSSLTGWEYATGKAKTSQDIYAMHKRPADRDAARDYVDGQASFGGSPPEGLVYLPEVLAFYLKHRPASRLMAPPKPDSPLDKVLKRVHGGSP